MDLMAPGRPTENNPKSRATEREARRLQAAHEALEQAHRARFRAQRSIVEKVQEARDKLVGRTVAEVTQLLDVASDQEKLILLLAEELGEARKGILSVYKASKSLREQYEAAQKAAPDPAPAPAAKAAKEKKDDSQKA